jgi:hypothetical protein
MTPSTDTMAAATAAFPELARLADLRKAGWTFFPAIADGELVAVQGVRTWPGGWADAIGIRYTTDAQGLRADHTGHIVWRREGTMVEVIDALLTLPVPGRK